MNQHRQVPGHTNALDTVTTLLHSCITDVIRPALQAHGGDVKLIEVTPDGIVRVQLQGACVSCLGAKETLQSVVEAKLRNIWPDLKGVEAVQEVGDDLLQEALAILRKEKQVY